jgi:hypothetical protein
LPFFCLYVLEWVEDAASWRPSLMLAVVMFGMFLQGSLHLVTWCGMFVALVAVFNWRLWKGGLVTLGFSGLLSAYRLIPGAIAYWRAQRLPFAGGYPSLTDLLDGLVVIREPTYPWKGGLFVANPWWEYDVFVGILGLAMLGYFGIYRRFDKGGVLETCRYACLDLPMMVLTLLSLNGIYALVYHLPLPLLNAERVTSRFIIIPLVMLLAIAAIRMHRVLETVTPNVRRTFLFLAALVVAGLDLLTHSDAWRIARWEALDQWQVSYWHNLEMASIVDAPDPVYPMAVKASAVVTVLAIGLLMYLWLRAGQRERAVHVSRADAS